MGSVMQRTLTIRSGQGHVHRYMKPLLEHNRLTAARRSANAGVAKSASLSAERPVGS
jgi:hypothetical protein